MKNRVYKVYLYNDTEVAYDQEYAWDNWDGRSPVKYCWAFELPRGASFLTGWKNV